MPTPSINPTYAINGKAAPLVDGTTLVVGQVVTFSATLAPGGTYTVFRRVNGVTRGPAVAWTGHVWTVTKDDLDVDALRINYRLHGADQPDTVVKVKVLPAASTDANAGGNGADISTAGTAWGFVANGADGAGPVSLACTKAKSDGATYIRLWHSHFGKIDAATEAIIRFAAAAGYRVILCVQPKDGGMDGFGSPDFAAFAATNADVLRLVALVEAGNELNLLQYRPGDFLGSNWYQPYVDRWLRPLSVALGTIGVKTMCASTTDTDNLGRYATHADGLIAAGAKACCVAVATHLYANPADFDRVPGVLLDLGTRWGLPVHVTECAPNKNKVQIGDYALNLAAYLLKVRLGKVASLCVYRGLPHPNAKVWPAALSLFEASGKPTPSYNAVLSAVR